MAVYRFSFAKWCAAGLSANDVAKDWDGHLLNENGDFIHHSGHGVAHLNYRWPNGWRVGACYPRTKWSERLK